MISQLECIMLNNLLTKMERGEIQKMVGNEIGKEEGPNQGTIVIIDAE